MTIRIGVVGILACSFSLILSATAAVGQNRAGPGFVESIETEGDPATGIDMEEDAAAAQAEQIESTGKVPTGLSGRRAKQVEEIVVSARRRAELLEDTPISVTAVNAETLVQAQVTKLPDLQYLVPNLQISQGRGGTGGALRIRGVGPTESGNPGVGTYIDGIFLQNGTAALLNVIDVQQVEVLRGPQGTLFGKNTLGGAVNFTTVAPSDELAGSAWLRAGSFGTVETRAMLSVPVKIGALEDKVFTRWSFASANSDGYTYNSGLDQYHNNRSALWFLGKVRVLPIEDLEINVNANYFQNKTNGAGGRCVEVQEADPSIRGLLLIANPNFFEKCNATKPFEFRTFSQMLYQDTNYGLWGNAQYSLGEVGVFDDLNVKLLGSWRKNKNRTREDIDLTEDLIIELTNINIGDVQGDPSRTTSSLVEGQVFGTALDGDISFIGGGFASWENNSLANVVRSNPPTLDYVGGFTVGPVERDESDWAFYGQAAWNLLEWLSLTGGIRYTSETRGVTRSTIFPLGGNPTATEPVVTSGGSDSQGFTEWTPMVSLQLTAPEDLLDTISLDHLMGYFTYSKGFSSGGFNAVVGSTGDVGGLIPFDPSTLDNYEIGFKTIGFDQRATFNLTLFYMDYQDIQVTQSESVFVPGQELPENVRLIVNASKATLKGIEAEVITRPIDGLLISGNIGVLDSEYGDFPDISALDAVSEINRQGETFNQVPEFTSYLAVQYSFGIDVGPTWLDGWLTPRLDWYYQTKVHNLQPEDTSGHVPGYNLLNARLSYDFLDDRAQVALWGRNLAAAEYFNTSGGTTGTFGYATQYFAPPISWGGEISYRFSAG
ncbi:MAG: TonB-dependent receptor [Candidatus Binatia bacterium]|nr:TonB-dependent receptor [Candidatus Binatia bacterium]